MKSWPLDVWHRLTMILTVAIVIGVLSASLALAYVQGYHEDRLQAYWHCMIYKGNWFEGPLFFICAGAHP